MKLLPCLFLTAVLGAVATTTANAQNAIDRAKDQYESAAYEEALSTLSDAGAAEPVDKVQLEQYRALCLIALGRLPEAERAISALVIADPTYVPSPSVASPKVLAMVADIRKKELPAIVRGLLDQGRLAYQAKDLLRARQTFELVLTLADDASLQGRSELDDVKAVARGFMDLAAATVAAAATPPVAPAPPPVAATPPPATTPSSVAKTVATPGFSAAVAIQQVMPVWEPPSRAFGTVEYNGAIKVRIGSDGKVISVSVEKPSHPAYDARLMQVALTWLYKPATRNGEPVESEKIIAVRLQPTS